MLAILSFSDRERPLTPSTKVITELPFVVKKSIPLKLSGVSIFREQTRKLKFKYRPCSRPDSTTTFQGSTSAILWCGEAHPHRGAGLVLYISSVQLTAGTIPMLHLILVTETALSIGGLLADRVQLQHCQVNSSARSVLDFYLLNCQSIRNKRANLNQW